MHRAWRPSLQVSGKCLVKWVSSTRNGGEQKIACAMDTVGEAVNAHPSSKDRKVVGFRPICGKEEQTNAVHHIGRIETTADPTLPPSPAPPAPNQTNHRQSSGQTSASIDPVPHFPPPLDPPDREIRQRLPSENGKQNVETQTLGKDLVKRRRWGSGG